LTGWYNNPDGTIRGDVRMSDFARGIHFSPIAVGSQYLAGPWGPGVRNCYVLHYVYSGRGYVECGGKTQSVSAGQSFLVLPNVPIRYYADKEEPWSYTWVDFDGDEASSAFAQTGFSDDTPVSPAFPENEVLPLFASVHMSFGAELFMRYEAAGRFYELFAYYLKNFPNESGDMKVSYMQTAVAFIKTNIHKHISVNDIAEHLNISRAHLYRVFQNGVSSSPGEFMTKYRIESACGYLEKNNLSIKAIAYSLGYENPLYFTKVFHRVTGMTPGQYRKENRIKDA
jgi:AraC-like DNA-binding protein